MILNFAVKRLFSNSRIQLFIFMLAFWGLLNNAGAQVNQVLEAEQAKLIGNAEVVDCINASGGKMVKGLDNGPGNALKFQNISIPEPGEYFVSVSYYAVNERNLTFQVNDKTAETLNVPKTGGWCYQGGLPGETVIMVHLESGAQNLLFYNSPIIDKIEVKTDTTAREAATIYISSSKGNDNNDGLTPETAFQSFEKINSMQLLPGDSVLFKSGDTFDGKLIINNESGNKEHRIAISNYGVGKLPVLNGDGYLSTIHIINSGFLHFSNLEIKNDGGPAKQGDAEDLRYGLYLQNTFSDGTYYKHFRFTNLVFKNIYPTTQITDDDKTGVNAHAIITSGSWGDDIHPTRFEGVWIENCFFTRTARHALVLKAINNLVIRKNLFEHVGGAGMVISAGTTNALVEYNVTNYTGSGIDSRMAGRGSGIWCYQSKNLTVQYNKFMHARGIHDSYGMHIDIGNRNVVYQYNYSEGNEGGFVEILGANVNVGYRYNLSVGDGWRKGGNRFGQVFWLAGWSGDPKNPVGSDSIFIYNNSIYLRDTIAPGIWIETVSKNARIYNNIIYAAGEFGPVNIKNNSNYNDFDFNIWYGNIPETDEDGEKYRGQNALISNPLFRDEIVRDSSGFLLGKGSPAFNAGKLIYNAGFEGLFHYFYNNGGKDFYGNSVSSTTLPNIGAFNGQDIGVKNNSLSPKNAFVIFPNPVRNNEYLQIEIPEKAKNSIVLVQITDVNGRCKLQQEFTGDELFRIYIKNLPGGSYFLKISSDNYVIAKQLLVF